MKAQHTPGPWKYAGTMNGHDLTIIADTGTDVWKGLAMNGGPGYIATVRTTQYGIENKGTEREANAALIAAAPELLEALRRCAVFIADNYTTQDLSFADQVNEAIRHAEGD